MAATRKAPKTRPMRQVAGPPERLLFFSYIVGRWTLAIVGVDGFHSNKEKGEAPSEASNRGFAFDSIGK